MGIPSKSDWAGYENDFDACDAYEIFFGLSNEETLSLYEDDVRMRYTDLRFMPVKAYKYYIAGFTEYVSKSKLNDLDRRYMLDCFINLVKEKLDSNVTLNLETGKSIVEALQLHLPFVKAMDKGIYGDLASMTESIINQLR